MGSSSENTKVNTPNKFLKIDFIESMIIYGKNASAIRLSCFFLIQRESIQTVDTSKDILE